MPDVAALDAFARTAWSSPSQRHSFPWCASIVGPYQLCTDVVDVVELVEVVELVVDDVVVDDEFEDPIWGERVVGVT